MEAPVRPSGGDVSPVVLGVAVAVVTFGVLALVGGWLVVSAM